MSSPTPAGQRSRGDSPEHQGSTSGQRSSLTPISLFLVLLAFWIMTQIEFVLILGLFGLLLGTILEEPLQKLQARRIPRPAGIFLIYAGIIGGLVLLGFIIVPLVADQADTFRQDVPERINQLEIQWRTSANPLLSGPGDDLLRRASIFIKSPQSNVSGDAAARAIPVLTSISTGIVGVLTLLVITFYYLMEKALIRRVVIQQLRPENQARINRIWESVEDKVGGWIRGQLLLCLIIGTIATISYGIVGLPFWPLLGLWAGLTEIIPIVGPWIGGVPAVIIALTLGWKTGLIVMAVIVGMQTLENWFLVPRVMRGAVGLTPLTVFVAILAGTQFMGPIGAVLAIPIAASLQVVITEWLDSRRIRDDTSQVSGWRWMLTRATNRDDDERVGEHPPRAEQPRDPEPAPAVVTDSPGPANDPGPHAREDTPQASAQWQRGSGRHEPASPSKRRWGALKIESPERKQDGKA